MNILAELRQRFEKALEPFVGNRADLVELAAMVRPSQQDRFGDFQANCAMPLGKQRGENPRELAARIVDGLRIDDLCLTPEVAGPGFINLTLRDDWLQAEAGRAAVAAELRPAAVDERRTYVVDFSGPNIAKPMHVGHLRSTVIGDALCRVLRYLGHTVIGDNHIGDWGTQFGMIIYGYKHFLDSAAFERNSVDELARLYRLVNRLCDYFETQEALPGLHDELARLRNEAEAAKAATAPTDKEGMKALKKLQANVAELAERVAKAEEGLREIEADAQFAGLVAAHPRILVETRLETARLHVGDAENRKLWDSFLPKCLAVLQQMYDRLDIKFDLALGESFYQPMLADVVSSLESSGLARVSEGATCVFLEGQKAPFIIRKGDGAFTYGTTDLATIRYRVETLHADVMLYVVDARQGEHFRSLFETARLWGYSQPDYRHVSFGTILGEDKRPFRTRSGDTVGLEGLVDEAISRAREIIDENDNAKDVPELDEQTRAQVAEIVGIGGIKYADLHHNRESDYVFSWEKMLAKTGDTATYIQYSYARICGIFRKGNLDRTEFRRKGHHVLLQHLSERNLALHLLRFQEAVDAVAVDYRPNLLTQHLFETADRFTRFYENCTVLKEEDEALRNSRLVLCDLTARTLQQGLKLLGIRTCEQM